MTTPLPAALLCVLVSGTEGSHSVQEVLPAAQQRGLTGLRLLWGDQGVWMEACVTDCAGRESLHRGELGCSIAFCSGVYC